MNYSVRKDQDCVRIELELRPTDICFLNKEVFNEVMPALQGLLDCCKESNFNKITNTYSIQSMQFTKFILAFIARDIERIKEFEKKFSTSK